MRWSLLRTRFSPDAWAPIKQAAIEQEAKLLEAGQGHHGGTTGQRTAVPGVEHPRRQLPLNTSWRIDDRHLAGVRSDAPADVDYRAVKRVLRVRDREDSFVCGM